MTEEHNTEARVRFGTRDWRHPEWAGCYYPEDLPEDWQLGYYANELNAVLLPAAAWQGLDQDALEGWADEVHLAFRFYLLPDPAGERPELTVFGDSLGGVLGEGGLMPVSDELPQGVRAWGDGQGIRVAELHLGERDLRARRALLEQLAPRLTEGDVAIILDWPGVTVAEVRELQTVAELLGIA